MMIKDPFLKGIAGFRSRGLVLPIYETDRQTENILVVAGGDGRERDGLGVGG